MYIYISYWSCCIVSPRWWKTAVDRWFRRCNPWNPFPKSWKTQREGPQGSLFWQKNLTQNGLEMAGKWFLSISELGIMSISCMKWTSDLGMILIVSLLSGWSLREETRKWRFGLWWLWKVLWLVVWLPFLFSQKYWEFHHPNWLIFFREVGILAHQPVLAKSVTIISFDQWTASQWIIYLTSRTWRIIP